MSAAQKVKLLPFEIEVTSGPHLGQKFTFVDTAHITIGRGTENQICLQHDPRISRVHAEIKQEAESFYIYNKSVKNFIMVNGHKQEQYKMTQTCSITIGESELKFTLPQAAPKPFKNPLQPLQTQVPVGLQQPMPQMPATFQPHGLPQLNNQLSARAPHPSQQLPPPQSGGPQRKRKSAKKKETLSPVLLIVVVAVILGIIFVLPGKKEESETPERLPPIITPVFQDEKRLQESMELAKEAQLKMENQNSRQAMAKQFFTSGMREYLNGNYQRAISFLNSAYQSDPTLVDAEKFSRDAQRKLDRLIDFYFAEGKKYRESSNFRMCKSSFQTVQLYIRNNLKHPRYVEAKQFYDECDSLSKVGRF